jgi:hypothetical protein
MSHHQQIRPRRVLKPESQFCQLVTGHNDLARQYLRARSQVPRVQVRKEERAIEWNGACIAADESLQIIDDGCRFGVPSLIDMHLGFGVEPGALELCMARMFRWKKAARRDPLAQLRIVEIVKHFEQYGSRRDRVGTLRRRLCNQRGDQARKPAINLCRTQQASPLFEQEAGTNHLISLAALILCQQDCRPCPQLSGQRTSENFRELFHKACAVLFLHSR